MKTPRTPRNPSMLRSAALVGAIALTLVVGCTEVITTEQRELAPEPEMTLLFGTPATQPTPRAVNTNEEAARATTATAEMTRDVTPSTGAPLAVPVRDFSRTTSPYENGDLSTDTIGFRYRTANVPVYVLPFAQVGVFLANVVTSPVTAYQQRNGILSSGLQFPATHTAMPVLPPRQEQPQPVQRQPAPDMTPTAQPGDAVPPPGSEPSVSAPPVAPAEITPVTLTPAAELSTNAFAIVGQVQNPGRYEAIENLTLAQAVLATGVAAPDRTKIAVKIERAGEEPASAMLAEILSGQTPSPTLLPGDLVTVTVQE